ncbi:MAG TPA: aromatic-ring-hydroxylating dioxygenase subunit beta [Burkholderiales bacterium]|nr:aromatic-ring-hydroxylating dioxygenase subunit beta [Burkholderiales bacterium]
MLTRSAGATERVNQLVEEYIAALDSRDFDAWLALYDESGHYAVLRRVEADTGNNFVLVGEDMKRLRGRVQSAVQRDKRRTLHTVSWIRQQSEDRATAGFALWMDGVPAYSGEYRFEFIEAPERLQLRQCTVVLDNAMIRQPIYAPI